MNDTAESVALQEQLAYYRARASEYDQWWLREGRYDRGSDLNSLWFADSATVREQLQHFGPRGHILELACGTGIWTAELLPHASTITAVDGSAEMLAITEARIQSALLTTEQADLFAWQPSRQYDTIFFGFWLSHVPPSRFVSFWQTVRSALAPRGRVFFVDSRHDRTSTARDHQLPSPETITLRRRLNDGREYQVYKVFYEASELCGRLQSLGWTFDISETTNYFIYGSGHITNEVEQGAGANSGGLGVGFCFP